jgi:hypothetical protein
MMRQHCVSELSTIIQWVKSKSVVITRSVTTTLRLSIVAALLAGCPCAAADPQLEQLAVNLADFGPLDTIEQAEAALRKALAEIEKQGGGVLMIPADAPADWEPENVTQEMTREPAPPAPANKGWAVAAGVTILDARQPRVAVPQVTGLRVERTFQLRENDSSPHWQYHPALRLNNHVVRGVSHYGGRIAAAVATGDDQRFYVETLQGIYPGQNLQARLPSGKQAQVIVKSLGFDRERRQAYFIADAAVDLPAGTELARSDALSAVRTTTHAHNELQTFDVFNRRWHYSQGDTYLYDAYLNYMGNESAASPQPQPDADGALRGSTALFAATTRGITNIFRGEVEATDTSRGELRYTKARNGHTLATGRPLINMNPAKWITAGRAYLMQPGGALLGWGGSIRSKDAPWTKAVVGRYFAVDEPAEYVPGGDQVRRWYLITHFGEENGIKSLSVRRYWWGAKNEGVGISRLYDGKHWSSDDEHAVSLKYIIAPGSYVYDVADGAGRSAAESSGGGQRLLRIAPYADGETRFDFARGDAIEQAIGPDPFPPIPFRAWFFDKVPSVFPAAAFDLGNSSPVTRSSAIAIGGKGYIGSLVSVEPGSKVGMVLNITGEAESAMMFRQKGGNPQTISWNDPPAQRTLAVNPSSGEFQFSGDIDLAGLAVTGVRSLSGQPGTASAANLRGIGIAVAAGAKAIEITLPAAEADDHYALKLETNWLTDRAITAQSGKSFTVTFSDAAPAGARLDWLLVR